MAKALVTPIVIPNCTRFACLDIDLSNNGTTITKATVKVQLRPAPGGMEEEEQNKTAYKTYTLQVINGTCDCLLVDAANPGTNYYPNLFHGVLKPSTVNAPNALSNLLTAINAANDAQKHNAALVSLSASGLIPSVNP